VVVDTAAPWSPHVVADRNLITGQNPMSSAPLADELVKRLG
jgi:putative intracellular protease/amidase